jgi:hypothetical protein
MNQCVLIAVMFWLGIHGFRLTYGTSHERLSVILVIFLVGGLFSWIGSMV